MKRAILRTVPSDVYTFVNADSEWRIEIRQKPRFFPKRLWLLISGLFVRVQVSLTEGGRNK